MSISIPLAAAKIAREILYAPPSMPALDLLAKMQATRIHLALVIDEYGGGGTAWSRSRIWSSFIVGDIADEHNEEEGPAVTRQADGSFLATGRASLEDVRAAIGEQFDVGEVARDVDTLKAVVIKAGHVPVRGELVPGPEPFEAEVLDADPRRVKRARIYLRKDRRPAGVRELPSMAETGNMQPAAPRQTNPPGQTRTRRARRDAEGSDPCHRIVWGWRRWLVHCPPARPRRWRWRRSTPGRFCF